jgi:hypothetical protein
VGQDPGRARERPDPEGEPPSDSQRDEAESLETLAWRYAAAGSRAETPGNFFFTLVVLQLFVLSGLTLPV